MAITVSENSFVVSGGQKIALSSMFSVSAATSNPTYLVLTGLDRNEYTASASDTTGSLSGKTASDGFSNIGGDGRGADIVFTYQASSGRYYSSIYGYFDQLSYTASSSLGDVTNLSLFGTNNLSLATANGINAYAMEQLDASGYLGSVTVATQPSFSGAPPAEATPDSICATAESFVGKAWNENGCWVLASTIAAEAGASLPVVSSMIGVGGQNNGEWFVAFDGSKQTGNWESLVKAGEIIVIGSSISGHITTCVAGSGSSAQLIDNVTYVNNAGAILNPANDGSSSDIIVSAAHAASQEWSGVNPADVVIYELDAPVVSTLVSADNLAGKAAQTLAALFSAKDPEGKTLNEYQVFDTASTDSFTVSGTSESAHSAGTAITVTSLSAIALQAGSSAATDTVEVRAFNGSYWGDWETLQVSVGSATAPPTIANQTAAQTWTQGQHVALTLPTNTFADPNGESLQLTANLSNGQPLPSWLSFTAASGTFSGIVPASAAAFGITVTATDTSGLSVSESFGVTVPAAVLKLATQTANQSWIDGQNVSFKLPSGTFIDPQGLQVSYAAYETSGISVTSWLSFNPTTETFSGKVPANANGIAYLEVIATDSSGAIATDAFAVSLGKTAVSLIGISQPSTHGIELLHG